jgi:DNA-binding CsgD family transcriptional regulator
MQTMFKKEVEQALGSLKDEQERQVLIWRFGLDGDPPKTLEGIGLNYGVTRERVRQIELKALRQLRLRPEIGGGTPKAPLPNPAFTGLQETVLKDWVKSYTAPEIAVKNNLDPEIVVTTLGEIYALLGVTTRSEVIDWQDAINREESN